MLNRAQYPSDVIALRDGSAVLLSEGSHRDGTLAPALLARAAGPARDVCQSWLVFSYEAVRDWEAKLTPALAEGLRQRRRGQAGCSWYVDKTDIQVHGRWCDLYRAIGRSGALVDVMFSEHRDMAAARALLRSAQATTGVIPDRVTTHGHDSSPRASRTELGQKARRRTSAYLTNRLE